MHVGLTYDLRAEYLAEGFSEEAVAELDQPETIDAIDGALRELGYETQRIGHARQLVQRLAGGERWDIVFNIAEGLHGYGREAQVPAILDVYGIPYTFSDPLVLALTLHKGMTKHVVRDLGVPTPAFAVVGDEADLSTLFLPFPLFVKPVAEGTGRGITSASKVDSRDALEAACRTVWESCSQPALVEEFLPGREFTVAIVGSGAAAATVGTMEIVLRRGAERDAYTYLNKEHWEDRVTCLFGGDALTRRTEELALVAWRGLGCRDAGRIDFRVDTKGVPNFMEVNPLAGLRPHHSDLPMICDANGVPFTELIRRIMDSALQRWRQP